MLDRQRARRLRGQHHHLDRRLLVTTCIAQVLQQRLKELSQLLEGLTKRSLAVCPLCLSNKQEIEHDL